MIANLMLYGGAMALLIGVATLLLERVAAWHQLPRRGLWAAAMAASVALPMMAALRPHAAPATPPIAPPATHTTITNPWRTNHEATPPAQRVGAPLSSTTPPPPPSSLPHSLINQSVAAAWLFGSLSCLALYVWMRLRMHRAARHWRKQTIDDQPVWITEALGPAVYGIADPVILLPRWALDAPAHVRTLILQHEQEHITARDPVLLLLGLILVALQPWNLPLWWQLRRLRFALEVDCDARIVRRGTPAHAYGKVLLSVAERRSITPLGAIALTEPASQLLRRVRIMTATVPRRGRWAITTALGASIACLAAAAQLQAPALSQAPGLSQAPNAVAALRKPPVGEDPRAALVEKLVRVTYPELFGAGPAPGPVLITLLMNPDGTLNKSVKESIQPRPWIPSSVPAGNAMDADLDHPGTSIKLRMPGGPDGKNTIDVRAWYPQPPPDPTRDVATVRMKVRAQYASSFASGAGGEPKMLTVFMTDSGEIDRAQLDTSPDPGIDPHTLLTPEHFAALGVPANSVGLMGTTVLYAGRFMDDPDLKRLRVLYAWPRRTGDAGPSLEPPVQPPATGIHDDPAVNRAIAEHYFPDLYTHPSDWPRADPWVLLDREGKVLATGRRVAMSGNDVMHYIEALYPGIRTDGFQVTTFEDDHGRLADVGFTWLAKDSPLTDPAKADLTQRKDLLLYADIVGAGATRPTQLMVMKYGDTAFTRCSLKNPFGMIHLEVTATAAGPDAIAVQVRMQHALLPGNSAGETDAVAGAWSPPSTPVRAPLDVPTDIHTTDQNGQAWTIVVHPERLATAQATIQGS
jgi:beta-lactamase regulating signal transducer with metallopeptidase domain